MRKKFLVFVFTLCVLFPLCVFPFQRAAAEDDPDEPVYDLPLFLADMGLNFKQYMELVDAFEAEGVYTYYIEEKDAGYTWFQQNNPAIAEDAAMAFVNIKVDFGPYSKISTTPNPDSVSVLVNKNHALPENWEPSDLVYIPGSGYRLRETAAVYFVLMRDTIRESGLNLSIVSAYRPYSTQRRLHRNSISSRGLTEGDMEVAREGHSEHQTGLSLDILHRSHGGRLANANFQDTDEYAWLLENAYKYGFILRYPEEYIDIHGYVYEPWHWRFVGTEISYAMHEKEITVYEEFYGKYLHADVLLNARALILQARAQAEADELARLETAAAERKAAEEASLAAQQAALEEEIARHEAAERELEAARASVLSAQNTSFATDILLPNNIADAAVLVAVVSFFVAILETITLLVLKRVMIAPMPGD